MDAREAMCQQVLEATGAHLIPPYNHPHVIAGQGTICKELLEQVGVLSSPAESFASIF
jgi:threonine dehydratase